MGSMQKKSNIFKDAQQRGLERPCAVILVSGSAPVTGYTLNIVSKDDSDLSVKVDDPLPYRNKQADKARRLFRHF